MHDGPSPVEAAELARIKRKLRYSPTEKMDVIVPASLNTLSLMNTAFMNCFGSQRAASFPSYEYDGPFSELAQKIMAEQYKMVKACLGEGHFSEELSPPTVRCAGGNGA